MATKRINDFIAKKHKKVTEQKWNWFPDLRLISLPQVATLKSLTVTLGVVNRDPSGIPGSSPEGNELDLVQVSCCFLKLWKSLVILNPLEFSLLMTFEIHWCAKSTLKHYLCFQLDLSQPFFTILFNLLNCISDH